MSVFSQIRREDLQWAQSKFDWDVVEDHEPYRSLVLERQRLGARSVFLGEELRTGGRRRKRHTNHAKKHRGIVHDYFGTPAILDENGVILERRIPRKAVECVMLSVTRTIVRGSTIVRDICGSAIVRNICGSTIVRDIRGSTIVRDIPFDYFLDSLSYRTIHFVQLT